MPLPRPFRSGRPRRRRLLTTPRRLLAAALLAVAAAVTVDAVAAGPPAGERLFVATRDLPAGHELTAGDLSAVTVPPQAVPDGALRAGHAAGRVLGSPVRRGEPVTDARLVGPGLLAAAPARTMAVPVRVAEPAALALLRPGDEVSVLAGPDLGGLGGAAGEVLVDSAVVLHVPAPTDGLLGGDAGRGGVVVLALDRAAATRVASAEGARALLLGVLP